MKCSLPWLVAIVIAAMGLAGCDVTLTPLTSLANDVADASLVVNTDANVAPSDGAVSFGGWMMRTSIDPAAVPTLSEDDAAMSPNELELTFAVATNTGKSLYQVSRASVSSTWGSPGLVPFTVNGIDQTPRYSSDGLVLYFSSSRAGSVGGQGNQNIWKVTRIALTTSWGLPQPVNEVNTVAMERWFAPCDDGRFLVASDRMTPDNLDLYEGKLGSGIAPLRLDVLSSATNETGVFLTADCNQALFTHSGATLDIYSTYRTGANWTTPAPIAEVNTTSSNEQDPWLSADGKRLLFVSDTAGSNDVYQMSRM